MGPIDPRDRSSTRWVPRDRFLLSSGGPNPKLPGLTLWDPVLFRPTLPTGWFSSAHEENKASPSSMCVEDPLILGDLLANDGRFRGGRTIRIHQAGPTAVFAP
jgi:hypothetical protein